MKQYTDVPRDFIGRSGSHVKMVCRDEVCRDGGAQTSCLLPIVPLSPVLWPLPPGTVQSLFPFELGSTPFPP